MGAGSDSVWCCQQVQGLDGARTAALRRGLDGAPLAPVHPEPQAGPLLGNRVSADVLSYVWLRSSWMREGPTPTQGPASLQEEKPRQTQAGEKPRGGGAERPRRSRRGPDPTPLRGRRGTSASARERLKFCGLKPPSWRLMAALGSRCTPTWALSTPSAL